MDYKDQTSMQKTQLSISVDEDLAKDVQEKLEMLGLDQSDFLIGLLTNIANNKKLPFSKLTNEEEEKAILKENNLAIDDAVKMLYSQFVLTGQLPFKIGKGKN